MSQIKDTEIEGNVAVGRNATVGGDATVRGNVNVNKNLKVEGWLEARNIKAANKGIFLTEDQLNAAYPRPSFGWWALVGDTLPAPLYVAIDGKWQNTGKRTGELSIDLEEYIKSVNYFEDKVDELSQTISEQNKTLSKNIQNNNLELLKRIQGTSDKSSPYYDPFKFVKFSDSGSESGNAWDDFNEWLDGLHTTTSTPDNNLAGFFRIVINGQLYEVHNFVLSWADVDFVQVLLGLMRFDDSGKVSFSSTYNIIQRRYANGVWGKWTDNSAVMQFSGMVRGDADNAGWAQTVFDKLKDGQMVEYVIGNSKGEISGGTVTLTESLGKLIHASDTRVAANLGDVLRIAKFDGKMYIAIIPKHEAKAKDDATGFPGTYGLMSPDDKMNLGNVLLPSKDAFFSNMDQCLEPGVYPWCTTGRPAGSTGAYTLVVRKTTSEDNNHYHTIEQTAYGREAEEGQVWRRIIFQPTDRAIQASDFHEWRRLDNEPVDDNTYMLKGNLISVSTISNAEAVLGSAISLKNAIDEGKRLCAIGEQMILGVRGSGASYTITYYDATENVLNRLNVGLVVNTGTGTASYSAISTATLASFPVNNTLTSGSPTTPLSANQGRILKGMIDNLTSFSVEVVGSLPNIGENGILYLVHSSDDYTGEDSFTEYIWVASERKFEPLGRAFNMTVDDHIDPNSVNPVQNRIIAAAFTEFTQDHTNLRTQIQNLTASVNNKTRIYRFGAMGHPRNWDSLLSDNLASAFGEADLLIEIVQDGKTIFIADDSTIVNVTLESEELEGDMLYNYIFTSCYFDNSGKAVAKRLHLLAFDTGWSDDNTDIEVEDLKFTDIVDNLTSTDEKAPLSANQGRILNEKLDKIERSFVSLTQAEYDALETKDENTIYFIFDDEP